MSERITYFVDVILPLSIPNSYTYRLPFELNDSIQVGVRVVVPLGKSKLYTGVVVRIHEEVPKNYQVKYVESLLDDSPIVTSNQFKLWKWISSYYMANIGDVMNAALPSNFKLGSETKISIHPEFERNYDSLSDKEYLIIEAIELQEELTLKEVSEILQIKTIQPLIKSLIEKKAAIVSEELKLKYRPKYKYYFLIFKFLYIVSLAIYSLFEVNSSIVFVI